MLPRYREFPFLDFLVGERLPEIRPPKNFRFLISRRHRPGYNGNNREPALSGFCRLAMPDPAYQTPYTVQYSKGGSSGCDKAAESWYQYILRNRK